jgi:hypothetical protein
MNRNAFPLPRQRRAGSRSDRCVILAVLMTVLLAACAGQERGPGRVVVSPDAPVPMRAPAMGQQWVYQVRDLYTGRVIDRLTETVAAIAPEVLITRHSDRYGTLPSEIQRPWGRFVQDAEWDRPLKFGAPVPAWPIGMAPSDWSGNYQVAGISEFRYPWSQSIRPLHWESLSVAAGEFVTLHYTVRIRYAGPEDYYYVSSEREASVWLAPQVGRWVLRRSRGMHNVPGHGGTDLDDATEWELVSWR